jgi:uncharacterized membrane protein YhiD involved in acid resistance
MVEPSAPTVAVYTTAGATVVAGLTVNEIGVYGGLVIAVATFALNWYYKEVERRDRREAEDRRCAADD